MSNKGVFFSLILVPVLNCGSQGSALAGDPGAGRLALTDAMLNMMDAMGMMGQRAGRSGGQHYDRAWESMAPDARNRPWQSGSAPRTGTQRGSISRRESDASRGTRRSLQGEWISQTGERLQIRGSRFRLRAAATREVDGTLSLRGHLLALHSPRYNHTWIYEFAEHEGRLALRDAKSRLYLYRRVQPGMHGAPQKHLPVTTPWKGEFYMPKYPSRGYMHQ